MKNKSPFLTLGDLPHQTYTVADAAQNFTLEDLKKMHALMEEALTLPAPFHVCKMRGNTVSDFVAQFDYAMANGFKLNLISGLYYPV